VPDEEKPPRRKPSSLGLSVRLPAIQVTPEFLAELQEAARRQGVSVAAAVRQGIRMWLDAAQKKES
jgi:hypothetical protein